MDDNFKAIVQPRIHSAKKQKLEDITPLETPISAHVDISSVCNFKCSFCFQADTLGMKKVGLKRGFMSEEMFKKIIDDFKDFPQKIKKIKIGNHGEPTLHPKIADFISYAVKSNTAEIIEVFTNASKLEPTLNEKIIKAGLQRINISLEGLDDKRYMDVAGVKQDFSKIISGVKDLYEKKIKLNSKLIIYVKIADEAHSLDKDNELIFGLSNKEKKYFYDTFGPICDEIFVEKIVPQWAETQQKEQNEVEKTGMYGQTISSWKKVCPFTFMYLHFNCDGTVSPCTLDWPRKVVIGNVKNESVSDIWNGQSLKDLRIAMLQGKRNCIDFCKSCSAPMVCVEENLDPHTDKILSIMNATTKSEFQKNKWLEA